MSLNNTNADSSSWHVIVGLGNPGKEYAKNRHNVGFQVLDRLAEKYDLKFTKMLNKGLAAIGTIEGKKVVLLKPQTYMNVSGACVVPTFRFYKTDLSKLLVVYDEIDIPFAQLRMRKLGGAAGHNGMRSIFAKLGSQEFPRLRVGVGRPPGRKAVHSHVLDDFTMTEKPQLEMMIDKSVEGIEIWLREGIDMAMNRINVTV